jgi:lipopolysaccharide assembly outer membrane protein LptD (OstA)
MKLLTPAFVACIFIFIPSAMCQTNRTQPQQVHVTIGMPGGGGRVTFTASTMARDLSSKSSESVMHFKGNVEARVISFDPTATNRAQFVSEMDLRADEVDYNEETGEISPRGHVSNFLFGLYEAGTMR